MKKLQYEMGKTILKAGFIGGLSAFLMVYFTKIPFDDILPVSVWIALGSVLSDALTKKVV
jgi:hypothetical protein